LVEHGRLCGQASGGGGGCSSYGSSGGEGYFGGTIIWPEETVWAITRL